MSFEQIFNQKSDIEVQAHARVNIIGEHTDYTGGFVMPTLLSFKTFVFFVLNKTILSEIIIEIKKRMKNNFFILRNYIFNGKFLDTK